MSAPADASPRRARDVYPFHAMLARGAHLPPSAFESWFVCVSHDDEAVETVLDALPDSARAAARVFATMTP